MTEEEPEHILVVDDDRAFLAYLRGGVKGFTVVAAHTPFQAIWWLEHQRFRAVVCDLVFRDVEGHHLLELVRDRWPATLRILVTGFGAPLRGSIDAALQSAAAQAVVNKPCDVVALDFLISTLPAFSVFGN